MPERIPFNRPAVMGNELGYIADAVRSGHASGDGPYTRRAQRMIEEISGAKKALLTPSCTAALDLAAHLIEIAPGDEVIVPSFTFPSTANAFVVRGARIVFADIRRDTLNLDEGLLDALITPQTRAIAVVHYAGVSSEMDRIGEIARERGITIVEDNAHGFLARYRGRPLGSFGSFGALSFHETKNVSCGEGGALLINDEAYLERAEIIRQKGTDRDRFFRGQVDKYSWVDIGSSYVLSDLLAAYLTAQLERANEIQRRRAAVWDTYATGLRDWAVEVGVQLPNVPAQCEQPYHMFYMIMRTQNERDALIRHLADRDIGAVFHYVPLHASPMGQRLGGKAGLCPVAEDVASRLVRLPFYNDLGRDDQDRVLHAIHEFGPR